MKNTTEQILWGFVLRGGRWFYCPKQGFRISDLSLFVKHATETVERPLKK
jgi:hypothetical protein